MAMFFFVSCLGTKSRDFLSCAHHYWRLWGLVVGTVKLMFKVIRTLPVSTQFTRYLGSWGIGGLPASSSFAID